MDSVINKLQEIGLNKMESEVYFLLLQNEPMTAYKIGKLLNKPTANIYKAVDSLKKQGAVVIQSGNKNLCKAVNYSEFLNLLQYRLEEKVSDVAKSLSKVKIENRDEGTYSLESSDLVIEKAKSMIDRAKKVLVIGVFPETFKRVKENLVMAIDRGVQVNILTFGDIDLKGANIKELPIKNSIIITWKGQQLNLVIDGQEAIISSFNVNTKELYHASWSTNVYLSCVLHRLFLFEHTLNEIMGIKNTEAKLAQIEEILKKQQFFHNSDVPGFQLIWDKFKQM